MKILTVQGLLLATSLIGGVAFAHATALTTEVRAESPETSWMTINLETPGSLGVEILYKTDRLSDVTHLRVTGELNAKDWVTISNLTSIIELDLSGAVSTASGIPNQAFENRTSLCRIDLPQGLPSIGTSAFRASGLESIVISESVKSLGNYIFYQCHNLVTADITGPASIPDYAFYDASKLVSVKLGKGPVSIGQYAFSYCNSLTSINFPEGLKTIGYHSFQKTPALEEVVFPATLSHMEQYAFDQSGVTRMEFLTDNVTFEG